jgi:hypothetical protein
MLWDRFPASRHNLSDRCESDQVSGDVREKRQAIAGTDRDEVGAGPGMVMTTKADRATMWTRMAHEDTFACGPALVNKSKAPHLEWLGV